MNKLIARLYEEPQDTIYLSFFRIFICFHLLKKVVTQWTSMEILYGKNTFTAAFPHPLFDVISLDFFQANYKFLLLIYVALIGMYLFGIGKHWTALAVYGFVELFQQLNGYILNGGDNYLKFVMLYMVFCDSYRYLSLNPVEWRSDYARRVSNFCTNLGAFSVRLHLCIIYMVTGLHKCNAKVWFQGVAMYYTLQLERFMGTSYNPILAKNGFIVTVGTYATLLWEIYFPVLIWFKRLKIYLLLIGVCFHSGVYVLMMIHDFQIFFIMSYGFFFNDSEWRAFGRWLDSKGLLPKSLSCKDSDESNSLAEETENQSEVTKE